MPNHPHNSDPSPPSPSNQPLQLTSDARDNIAPDTNPPYRGRLATERNPFDGDPAHVGASPPARDSAFGGPPGVAADGGVPGTAGGPPPGTAPAPHADCRVARDGAPTASPVPADGPDPHPSLAHVGASPPARDSAFGGPPGVAADGGVPGTAGGPPPGTAPAPHADCRVARDGAPAASPVPADGPDPHPSLDPDAHGRVARRVPSPLEVAAGLASEPIGSTEEAAAAAAETAPTHRPTATLPASAPARPAGSDSLESNRVTSHARQFIESVPGATPQDVASSLSLTNPAEEVELRVAAHRCGSWWCSRCARSRAMRFRHALLPRISEWRQPTMITLTVDRSGWPDGAESVWEHVSSKSLVARLMRRLGIDRWLWVVEWQSASGEGWPHWHVLVDWPGFVDYREVRRLWWGLWNIGNIDVKPVGARGGIWYLSAYMTKGCSKHPQWILERRQTVRKCGGSKAMGPC